MKMKMLFTRSLAKMAAPASIDLFHFTLGKDTGPPGKKNANILLLLLLRVKIPFVYCYLNMENLSVTSCLHTFVRVCFLATVVKRKSTLLLVVKH